MGELLNCGVSITLHKDEHEQTVDTHENLGSFEGYYAEWKSQLQKAIYTVIISFIFEMRKSIQMENRLLAAND